jgi:hypothetical protein
MRLDRDGGRILLDPAIQGKHLKRWTLAGMVETDLRRRGVPWVRLLLEERSPSTALNLDWSHRVATAAALGAVGGLVLGRFKLAAGSLALLVAVDRGFYGLLLRKRGPKLLAAGVPLHVVHRLTAAAAIPIALADHLTTPRRSRRV